MADKVANKIIFNSEVLIDLTADTVEADKLLTGYTAHGKSGAILTGTCDYDANTQDATAAASEILATKTAYVAGAKVTGSMPNIGEQTGAITTVAQEVAISAGYHDGSGKVAIDATEQAKIIPSNILEGITVLGVTGTVEPSSEIHIESSKTVTPSATADVTVLPSTGYDAMAEVVVSKISYSSTENPQGGLTITIA